MISSLVSRQNSDEQWDANEYNFFGFTPSIAAAVVYIVAFSLLSILHTGLTLKSRFQWGHLMAVGGICEIIGHVGRLGGHYKNTGLSYYLMQQVCTVIAPTFWIAFTYAVFCRLVPLCGTQWSRFRPKWLVTYLLSVDIISLILQGVGGGMSGAAGASGNNDTLTIGRDIYLAGISFQLFNTIVFAWLVAEYIWRMKKDPAVSSIRAFGGRPLMITLVSLMVTNALIILRNVFREFELSEGFTGRLATTEIYFALLDALPMVGVMVVLAIGHPLFGLNRIKLSSTRLTEDEKHLRRQHSPEEGIQTPSSSL